VERAHQDEERLAPVPVLEQALRQLAVAYLPVAGRRLGIEAVEEDHPIEATFVAQPLQEREVACRDAPVAAEELSRLGQ